MATLKERILDLLARTPSLTDREITNALLGRESAQQPINQACHRLRQCGLVDRRLRPDGRIGNYLRDGSSVSSTAPVKKRHSEKPDPLSEDSIKTALERWLRDQGWETKIAWGKSTGIDIEARRGTERWIIEAKGRGVSPQAQGNYFLGALAELVQRMTDADCRYSLAFPALARYQGLWNRLPVLAKSRLKISMLFIDEGGNVIESRW